MNLNRLDEHRQMAEWETQVDKARQKAGHDRNLCQKKYQEGDLVLLYHSRVKGKPKKFTNMWNGPFMIQQLFDNGSVKLRTLQSEVIKGLVNGARLKHFYS